METTLAAERGALKLPSLAWAVGLSALLFISKMGAALVSSSQALLASALDSLMDMGVSTVNLISVKKAAQPPDEDHAYGHEKIESLASYSQGILILIFALLLFGESVRRTVTGSLITHSEIALAVIGFSIGINLLITQILHRAEEKTHSLILKAEKTHYGMDLLSYGVILLALLLVRMTGWPGWDLLGGTLVGGYVTWLALQILIQAAHELVDRSLPQGTLEALHGLIRSHDPRVLGYHELRTRRAGEKTFIDFHLVLNPAMSFEEAHSVAESLIERIKHQFPQTDVTIHEDPEGGL